MDMVGHYAIRSEDDTISQEEREQWDKFWTLDAAGTEEFSGTEKAARAEQDKKKELVVFHPIGQGREEIDDPQYFPSKDLMVLQTKQQAIKALETSCQLTEKFWTIWQTQYLTALREKHTLQVTRKKGCAQPPSEGTLVLISDPILPRHSWKMGTIDQVIANPRGTIREAVVRLPSQRLIRRPVNLLIPLELDDDSAQRAEHSEQSPNRQGDAPEYRPPAAQKETGAIADQLELQPHARYNLRKRRHVDYSEEEDLDTTSPGSSRSLFSIAALLQITIVLLLSCFVGTTTSEQPKASIRLMQCIPGGVHLVSPDQMPYEICAEHYCVQLETPQLNETIALPPEIVLHEHRVRWKYSEETSVNTIETTCPPSPFCQSIRCTFCSANILNPECWPKHAIFATAILLYCFITGCYVFLYVPLVLGKPLRVAGRILWAIVRYAIRHCWRLKRSTNRGQFSRRRIAEIIAIVFLIPLTQQCQQINLFTHYSTICTKGSEMTCQVQVSEVFKINPFKREACLRLSQNNTAVHEIHLQWNSLVLTCEPITDLFTRDTVHKVIDSKRCPHSGSCVGTKCGSINASSLIPELAIGNQYPGNTACVESCGGLGCDCFYPSSGCLFYRIYLVPVSDDIFELFHCNRWTEAAKIQVTHLDRLKKTSNTVTKFLLPNVPVKWGTFTITLSSIGIPPLPLLNTPFISNNKTTALWKPNMMPALRCSNLTNARNLACEESIEPVACDFSVNILPARPAEKSSSDCVSLNTLSAMARNEYPQELEKLATLHKATRKTIESEITSAIDNIIRRIRLAGAIDASWTHHLMVHTSSEAGAGAQALQLCKMIRDATIARESLMRFTERFLLLQSRLQYDTIQGKPKSQLTDLKEDNIKEKVIKTLKKLDNNIEEMQQELNRLEGLVNMETTCMQDLKSMIRTMDQKVKTFAPSTPQQDPLEDTIEPSPEHEVTATTETTTIEEPKKEASGPSEEPSEDRGTGEE
ncbi:hypothetical protein ANCCAN_08888 [Ancylostoma caninum]|uniref:Phlebovirus glycoprotein G2 fusion domain-containing protein n=1 Tax=Ancylostoma caninum TaxID=29170 RepID=A0A368GN75_ANCCA|nr:hypothetical protein ANCCAN_08888 [Ancylostoma caninum]